MSKISYFFLLGGQDLEMLSIRELLEENGYVHGQDFLDKQLAWGASWKDYENEIAKLDQNVTIVGIELSHKDAKPTNAIDIDHHNERSDEKSSLEQVAKLLNLPLSRKQLLIAANDRAYIPGMEAMNATPKEIDKIRRADRQAQGVTPEDERLAEKAIEQGKSEKGVFVVKAFSNKFSPIADRLHGKEEKLLVYTSSELTYYGFEIKQLAKEFKEYIKEEKAYFGGYGDAGFFGIVNGAFSEDELIKIKGKIIKIVKRVFSKHIFLFPFSWDNSESFKLTDSRWKKDEFSIKDAETYNESTYFYEFVRKAMYDYGENDDLLQHYEYNLNGKPTYSIFIKGKKEPLILDVNDIMINLYNTGVGILSFHLDNTRKGQADFHSILEINEFGRRIYPQFLGRDNGISETHKVFLAEEIILKTESEEISDQLKSKYPSEEISDQLKSKYPSKEKYGDIEFSNVITKILPKELGSVSPILDDRMFVICWYGNDDMINKFSAFDELGENYHFEESDDWSSFLFVDKDSPTIANKPMKRELLKKHSYARWVENQQLFGISRYSFVAMTKNDGWLIPHHMVTMYYKMIELTIVQRVSALNFAKKAAEISKLDEKNKDISQEVSKLLKAYIEFQNRIYFREVTAQEQGIELYNMMQELLRTERDVKELDREIDELNQYANMIEEKKQTELAIDYAKVANEQADLANKQAKLANKFAIYAAIFIPATILTGILGMNTVPPDWRITYAPYWPFWISLILISAISWGTYKWISNKDDK